MGKDKRPAGAVSRPRQWAQDRLIAGCCGRTVLTCDCKAIAPRKRR